MDFCPGINVLIGSNGTGKTTLMKFLYWWVDNHDYYLDWESNPEHYESFTSLESYFGGIQLFVEAVFPNEPVFQVEPRGLPENIKGIYIPEKDILEHARGLLPFIEQKQTGFSQIYKDVLIDADDVPTRNESTTQKSIREKLSSVIGGEIVLDKSTGSFYTLKTDGSKIPFAYEASGYKRLGFLGLLVASGRLEPGSILFWDEPENSLNPEIIPALVDILLELSRNGVQILLATHSEIFAHYFSVDRKNDDQVMFASLYKEGAQIKADTSDRFDLLTPNNLTAEPVKLYEKEIERAFGNDE